MTPNRDEKVPVFMLAVIWDTLLQRPLDTGSMDSLKVYNHEEDHFYMTCHSSGAMSLKKTAGVGGTMSDSEKS